MGKTVEGWGGAICSYGVEGDDNGRILYNFGGPAESNIDFSLRHYIWGP